MPERVRIRSAVPADAEPLTALAEQTFRDTFAADNAVGSIPIVVAQTHFLRL